MKILVPIKQVLDPGLNVFLSQSSHQIDDKGMSYVINPFCANALEQAVQFKEQGVAEEVIVVSIGVENIQEQLRKALALGADRAIHIVTPKEMDFCSLEIAKILYQLVKKEQPDLVILGKQSVDLEYYQTGQMLAALLDWPQAICVSKLSMTPTQESDTACSEQKPSTPTVFADCELDDGTLSLQFELPGIVTADLSLNEPRFANLMDIMKAQSKPVEAHPLDDYATFETPHIQSQEMTTPQHQAVLELLPNEESLAALIKQKISS